jgi:hypothetical protein
MKEIKATITRRNIQATIKGAIIKGEQGEQGLQGEVDYNLVNAEIQRLVDDFISQIDLQALKGTDGLDGQNGLDGLNGIDGVDAQFDYDFVRKQIQDLFEQYKPSILETTKTLSKTGVPSYKVNEQNITKEIKRIFNSWKKDLGNLKGEKGDKGEKGERGAYGPQGPVGQGIIGGGNTGQVLTKKSNTSYDLEWKTPTGGGGGGSVAWGGITGTLSDQTDLQTALNEKQGIITNSDSITQGSTNLFLTTAERTKLTNTSGTNTGDQNTFSTIAVSGQSDVVADSTSDTLTLVAGSNITLTTNATNDEITIDSTGGGGGGGFTYPQLLSAISLRI